MTVLERISAATMVMNRVSPLAPLMFAASVAPTVASTAAATCCGQAITPR